MLIAVPITANLFSYESKFPGKFNMLRQNQKIRYKPIKWDKEGVVHYLSNLNSWYSDNFGFRNELVKLNSLAYSIINTSAIPDKVIMGRNNFLFAGNIMGNAVSQHQGIDTFCIEELDRYHQNLATVKDFFNERGVKFYMTIVPGKHSIYDDYLPVYARKYFPDRYDQIISFGNGELDIIDLREILLEAREQYGDLVYNKSDTHWSKLGAYFAYLKIISRIKEDFPDLRPLTLKDFEVRENNVGMDLAYKLNLCNRIDDYSDSLIFYELLDTLERIEFDGTVTKLLPYEVIPDHESTIVVNKNKKLTILIIKDSFSVNLSYLLNQNFCKIIYIKRSSGKTREMTDLVKEFSPDIVLFEVGERKLNKEILDPEPWYDLETFHNAETSLKLNGKEILEFVKAKSNLQVINRSRDNLSFRIPENKRSSISFNKFNLAPASSYMIRVKIHSPQQTISKLFFTIAGQKRFTRDNSVVLKIQKGWNQVIYKIDHRNLAGVFRYDPSYRKGIYQIESIEIKYIK